MATTVQKQLLKLALVASPRTKNGNPFNDASAALTINAASNTAPIVIGTTTPHGLNSSQQVYVAGVTGNTNANNTAGNPNWPIIVLSPTTFSLTGSSGNSAYAGGPGTVTAELIGSVDGENIPRQRLLDIYNFARYTAFIVMKGLCTVNGKLDLALLGKKFGSLVTSTSTFQFASGSGTKPAGYLEFISLADTNNAQIYLLDQSLKAEVLKGVNPYYIESSTNRFVFDIGNTLVHYSNQLPDVSTYKLNYFGISDFTLSDVLGNSTTETFNEQYMPGLIELAQAIVAEQGEQQLNALATKLFGK